MKEKTVFFENKNQKLYGIVHEPEKSDADTAVIFLHGWGTYRIGPHRFFVDMARSFAEDGVLSLRFDFRGRGESEGNVEDTILPDMIDDAGVAVKWIREKYGISRIVLLGLCSGGEVAVGAASADPGSVDALVLVSTPLLGRKNSVKESVRKSANFAKSYWQKLFLSETWKKVFRLQVNYRAIFRILTGAGAGGGENHSEVTVETELMEQFSDFRGDVLFIYGKNDPEAELSEEAYRKARSGHENTVFRVIPDANHNFYSLKWKKEVIELIRVFLKK